MLWGFLSSTGNAWVPQVNSWERELYPGEGRSSWKFPVSVSLYQGQTKGEGFVLSLVVVEGESAHTALSRKLPPEKLRVVAGKGGLRALWPSWSQHLPPEEPQDTGLLYLHQRTVPSRCWHLAGLSHSILHRYEKSKTLAINFTDIPVCKVFLYSLLAWIAR